MLKSLIIKLKNTSENNKIVFKNVIGAFGVKGLSLLVSLFTMPAYIRFFNDETVLGLWFTILSVLSWILNFDLGIGNGLRNHLAGTIIQNKKEDSKKYISSAYISVGVVCIVIIFAFAVVFDFLNWNKIFNISTEIVSSKAMNNAVKIVFAGIILQLFFKLINSILYALQKSSVNNFLNLCSTVISLILVLILPSKSNEQNIIVMAVVHLLAVIIPLIITTIIVFSGKTLCDCIPSLKNFSLKHAKDVLFLGSVFLILQFAQLIIMATNEYLITYICSNEFVVDYQIYHKIAILGSTAFSLALIPIWSAVTKAIAERNYNWVEKLYKRFVVLGSLGVALEFLMIPFYQLIIDVWLGSAAIKINYFYAFTFAVLGSLIIFNSIFFYITNGTGELKLQTFMYIIGAIAKIPLSWALSVSMNSWIGVVWANVIAMSAYCLIQPLWLKKYLDKKKKEVLEDVTI